MTKLAIAVISSGSIMHDYMLCLIHMLKAMPYDFEIIGAKSCLVPKNRRVVAERFIESDCTHLLFIDADMYFPGELAEVLVSRDKPVVAVNCTNRIKPVRFHAMRNGKQVSSVGKTGIEEVDVIGTGVMLIKKEVFTQIAQPWFTLAWNEKLKREVSEDYWFCDQVRKAGMPVFIDHDLAQVVTHMGIHKYGVQDIE